MASVKGVNTTLQTGGGGASDFVDVAEIGGRVRLAMDTYEASSLAAGSDIQVVSNLPAGARILPISFIHCDALGTSVTISAGTTAGGTDLVSATSANTANKKIEFDKIDALGVELTTPTDIFLNVAGAAATGTIRSYVFYTVD